MNPFYRKLFSISLSSSAREWISFLICLMCLGLFAVSAYEKVVDHDRFFRGLLKVEYVGDYAEFVSLAVPVSEIIISLLLVYPPLQKIGLYGFVGLMVVFTLYIGSMLLWAEKLPCYCNLIIEKLSFGQHLAFNMIFIALAVYALWLKNKHYKN